MACGADVNARQGADLQAPLHLAATRGEIKVVQYLLSVAATVDIVDANGWTPLHVRC